MPGKEVPELKKGFWDAEVPDEKVLSGTNEEEVPEEKDPPNVVDDDVGPLTKLVLRGSEDELPNGVEGCLM